MYQVLLVDDESTITNSLAQWIPWCEFDMKVAAIASSGEEALTMIQTMPINIVLTDIRMQGIGGLELCQMLHHENPDVQIIIMSGYAEFSYVQKALKYGILGYCLKPLEHDEVCMYLNRAVSRLRSKDQPLSQDDFLNALQDGNISNIQRFLETSGFSGEGFYIAVSTSEKPLPNEYGLTLQLGRNQFAYLTSMPITNETITKFSSNGNIICVGIIPDKITIDILPYKIKECQTLAWQSFINPPCKICDSVSTEKANNIIKEVNSLLSPNKIIALLQEIQCNKEIMYSFSIKSAMQLYNAILSGNPFLANQDDLYVYSLDELIFRYPDFNIMLEKLVDILSDIKLPGAPLDKLSNQSFLQMINYITTNYEKNILLTDIAKLQHLNPNYLSQIFKKETGITFTKYLTDLRISKAKQLMAQSNLSISEIALKVGFNDYFYFLKTFKKITGQTPSQYRLG